MVRLDRIALAAGGPLARAALGFLGLTILIGWTSPPPETVATASDRPGDRAQVATTVTLRVPKGELAKHLTVVDGSGRELAILTHWMSGMTTVVSRRSGEAGVSYHLNPDGSAKMRVDGTTHATLIDAGRDGRTRIWHQAVPPLIVRRGLLTTETATGSDERQPFGAGADAESRSPGP